MMKASSSVKWDYYGEDVKAVASRDVESLEDPFIWCRVHKSRRINHSLLYESIDRIA